MTAAARRLTLRVASQTASSMSSTVAAPETPAAWTNPPSEPERGSGGRHRVGDGRRVGHVDHRRRGRPRPSVPAARRRLLGPGAVDVPDGHRASHLGQGQRRRPADARPPPVIRTPVPGDPSGSAGGCGRGLCGVRSWPEYSRRSAPRPPRAPTGRRRRRRVRCAVRGRAGGRRDLRATGVGLVPLRQHRVGDPPVAGDGRVVPGHTQLVLGVVVAVDQVPEGEVGQRGEAVGHPRRDEQAPVVVARRGRGRAVAPSVGEPWRRSWRTTRAVPASTYQ